MPMPDPSGESRSAARHPPDPAQAAAAGEPAHLHPAPRLHPVNAHHVPETQAPVPGPRSAPDVNDLLEWMRRNGLPPGPAVAPAPPPSRGHLPKEQRKFHKFDPEHPNPELPPPRTVRADDPVPWENAGEVASEALDGITAERQAYMRRQRQQTPEHNPWVPVGLAVLVFLLVFGAFVVGHFTLPRISPAEHATGGPPEMPVVEAKMPGPLPAGLMEVIDRATEAETAKDYPKAIQLLEQAQREAGHIHGLNYRLASLCYKANEMTRVLPLLNLSINQGEEVAACYCLRGTLSNQYEGTERGPGDLEKATLLDPLNARYFFVWGEALRRAGKPQEALVQLRRALDRLQEPALLGMYSLKVRLTQIELNDEDQFASEMAAEMKRNAPPTDWLWTAAAVEMHAGHVPAAAQFLARIRAVVGEQETATGLQDVFFASFARENTLAEFYDVSGTR